MLRSFISLNRTGIYLGLASVASRNMSTRKLEGKVAIVTASTDGIGFAIARRLGQDGAHVVISSRKQANVDQAVKQLQSENLSVMGMVCHVGKDDHRTNLIEETVKKYGGIDILVSNAAVNPYFGPILDATKQVWDKIMEVNVTASFMLCKEVVPHMEKKGGGSIILVTSIGGYQPMELLGPYSVSKTALLGLVKALMPACAKLNIRVNALAPGVIKTRFSEALWNSPAAEAGTLESIPMGRLGLPEDMAGTVSFLASDDSSYITGETILATGGLPSRL